MYLLWIPFLRYCLNWCQGWGWCLAYCLPYSFRGFRLISLCFSERKSNKQGCELRYKLKPSVRGFTGNGSEIVYYNCVFLKLGMLEGLYGIKTATDIVVSNARSEFSSWPQGLKCFLFFFKTIFFSYLRQNLPAAAGSSDLFRYKHFTLCTTCKQLVRILWEATVRRQVTEITPSLYKKTAVFWLATKLIQTKIIVLTLVSKLYSCPVQAASLFNLNCIPYLGLTSNLRRGTLAIVLYGDGVMS